MFCATFKVPVENSGMFQNRELSLSAVRSSLRMSSDRGRSITQTYGAHLADARNFGGSKNGEQNTEAAPARAPSLFVSVVFRVFSTLNASSGVR